MLSMYLEASSWLIVTVAPNVGNRFPTKVSSKTNEKDTSLRQETVNAMTQLRRPPQYVIY